MTIRVESGNTSTTIPDVQCQLLTGARGRLNQTADLGSDSHGTDIRIAGESAKFVISEAKWKPLSHGRLSHTFVPADPLHRGL